MAAGALSLCIDHKLVVQRLLFCRSKKPLVFPLRSPRAMDKGRVETNGPDSDSRPHDDGEFSGAATRMREAILAAAMGNGANGELDAAAKALVSELRRAKEPPEQVLVQIKQILAEAGLRPSHGPADPALLVDRHVAVYRDLIESTIRYYFESGDGDGRRPI